MSVHLTAGEILISLPCIVRFSALVFVEIYKHKDFVHKTA